MDEKGGFVLQINHEELEIIRSFFDNMEKPTTSMCSIYNLINKYVP